MKTEARILQQLVLVGGGHAHIEVLRRWIKWKDEFPNIRLVLISPSAETFYSGMLPGYIAGDYAKKDIMIDLEPLAARSGAIFFKDEVVGIDSLRLELELKSGLKLPYTKVSFDIGSGAMPASFDLSDRHVLATRPFSNLLQKLSEWDEELESQREASLLCLGAGAAGFELVFALQKRFPQFQKIALVDSLDPVPARLKKELERKQIQYHPNCSDYELKRMDAGFQFLRPKMEAEGFSHILWAAGARAHKILWSGHKNALSDRGFIRVNDRLQSKVSADIFAAGDCAEMEDFPYVKKAGVYAVRQSVQLAENLLTELSSEWKSLNSYKPQRRFLRLLNYSDGTAELQYGKFSVKGRFAWNLKDYIDRKFMRKYSELAMPPMQEPECSGCGSKLAASSLDKVLADALPGIAARKEDIGFYQDKTGRSNYFSIDGFKALPLPPFQVGRIATVHALSDFYASGVKPEVCLANITLARLAPFLAEFDLRELIRGIRSVCSEEGVELVGGQTMEGRESSIALAVYGHGMTAGVPWANGPLQGNRKLILTKPLGTGVLFAARMQGAASGEAIDAAIASMMDSNKAAFDILQDFENIFVTDITGFGLAGHLAEMLQGSTVRLDMDWQQLPLLAEAEDLLQRGYSSRLQLSNQTLVRGNKGLAAAPAIAFDPQTSGGLLVAVPTESAEDIFGRLRASYPQARIIGQTSSS